MDPPLNHPVAWPYAIGQDRFLTDAEERQLEALFAQILPRDPTRRIPGATDAGAARFVSLLLAMDAAVYDELPAWRHLYRPALAALEAYAVKAHGKSLTELAESEMTTLLEQLEKGDLQELELPDDTLQPVLFKTLRRHCLQGCFSDPRWGGNRDKIMWRWLGYPNAPEEVL